ncbi:uncharacterized protein METZ01_LOCUS10894 [marine metagenome]|uniref:Uncharacterized protein n=1 Tax=marine metagenome TaxID=408172 RepID=A0A381NU02_9ZZZZ
MPTVGLGAALTRPLAITGEINDKEPANVQWNALSGRGSAW